MKKKALSFILAVVMIFSLTATPAFAIDFESSSDPFTKVIARVIGTLFEDLVAALNHFMRENDKFVDEADYVYDNFYEGTAEFIDEAVQGAKWSLGQSDTSLVPENWEDYNLFLGGFISEQNFFTNDVREILDDMKVRVIALNDGSGRGTAVFATIDSIGVSNGDIRHIRGLLSDFAKANNINSINIFATHTHSGIDTQGLWTDIFSKWPTNILSSFTGIIDTQQGTDPEYMEFFYSKVASAIEEAVGSMAEGTMTFARKDIGEKYFNNKNRPSASSLDTELKRFVFTPDDASLTPTIILNMSAHPDVVGLATEDDPTKGHGVSGDYIYYIGETINNAGYNFMFFNGAIAGIYIGRVDVHADKRVDIAANYGREIGKMVLGMTMTEEEILADEYLMGLEFTGEQIEGLEYIPWHEGWVPATEEAVEPILNIKLGKAEIHVTNPVIQAAGKLGVVNYLIKKSNGNYYVDTEIGYMELGKNVKIALVPGELCTDLAYGGNSLTAEGSVTSKDYKGKTLVEIFGEDLIVFGVANDAVGYIIPENDYCTSLAFGHYQETLSLGKTSATMMFEAYETLLAE